MRQQLFFTIALATLGRVLFLVLTVDGQSQRVKSRLGSLKGWTGLSRSGRDYAAFTKIPYAKPPTGSLRFKNPVEFGPWEGEYDATEDVPFCPQSNLFGKFVGTEDCLYLNVYTPKIKPEKKLPVLFYIHGGAFKFGHPGHRDMANYLMDEDVVLVTTTYRVGVMGFLSLEDSSLPGNFGLKDQATALKWAKDNVDSFGGDPDLITLIGESAGGASVHHLMLSPLTRNLIKGGISMSGTVNRVWSLAASGLVRNRAIKVAKSLGCHDIGEALTCLQGLPLEKIATAESLLASEDTIPFKPTIEPKRPGAIITDDPLKAPSEKPWITSFASGEFILGTFELKGGTEPIVINKVDEFLKDFLKRRGVSKDLSSKVKKLKDKYITDAPEKDLTLQVAKCWANMTFVYPALDNLEKHVGPKYAYHLEFKGDTSILNLVTAQESPYAGHADELVSLFNFSPVFNKKQSPRDAKFSKDFIRMVLSFARTQTPVIGNSSLKWKQWNGNEIMRLTGDGFHMADEAFSNEQLASLAFWKDIFSDNSDKDEL